MAEEGKGLDIPDGTDVPRTYQRFTARFPAIAEAHEAVGRAGDQGPLDRKTVELIKLGICVGAGLESASKSHARRAVQHGAGREAVEQAVALAVNPVGLPRAVMGLALGHGAAGLRVSAKRGRSRARATDRLTRTSWGCAAAMAEPTARALNSL